MNRFHQIFPQGKAIVGMVHVGALPGTPAYKGSLDQILDQAIRDAVTLKTSGMDGIMIENMHDLPYLKQGWGPETATVMTRIGMEIQRMTNIPCGIQILAGANEAAIAVALASGLEFIRAEGFVFGHVADEGWMDAQAGPLLRYRQKIDAERVAIFADIKKKHSSHAITSDVDLLETAQAAQFFMADGVIITGQSTGKPVDEQALESLVGKLDIPTWIGSGLDAENAETLAPLCDGVIVGSSIKRDGAWQNEVDLNRASRLVKAVKKIWNI
jgi:membrane complex biogenesis BtpA family protein